MTAYNNKIFINLYNLISFIINTILSLPLVFFQSIVFIVYFSIPSFLCLAIIIFIQTILYWIASASEEISLRRVVSEDLIDNEDFSKCNFKSLPLKEILGTDDVIYDMDSRLKDPTYIFSSTKIYKELNKSMTGFVSIYQIINPIDKDSLIIPLMLAYPIVNKSFIFITDHPSSMGILQKFSLYHEIGHALSLGKISKTETKLLRMLYISTMLLIPFELEWTWQAFLLFITFSLSSLDFFGNSLLRRFNRDNLQSEVTADEFAIQQLNDAEKEKVLRLLKSGKGDLRDLTFTNDDNYIRLGRLMAKLEDRPEDNSLLANVSFLDNQYRFLFLLILALNTYNPTYWHVVGFGLFAVWFGIRAIKLTKESMTLNVIFHEYLKARSSREAA